MKNTMIILLLLGFACAEESMDKSGNMRQLSKITVNGKPDQIFEYDHGLLSKEDFFGFCEQNPSNEYAYFYQDCRLTKISSTLRGHYANSDALCDPSTGIHADEHFEYNIHGQISKIIRANSYAVVTYNISGRVEKEVLFYDQNTLESNYKYDSWGNMIEVTDFDGNTTHYAYDDKINPFYRMNQHPGRISPFNKSPNNVVKAWGKNTFERTFEYDAEGFPSKAFESNGLTYLYIYQ